MKTTVDTKFQISGFHNYPLAPDQVAFLANKHRHTFNVTCSYLVNDLNREREIFICRDEVKSYLIEAYGSPCEFENMSCEMIAKEILEFGLADSMVSCSVWEEETGGATVSV